MEFHWYNESIHKMDVIFMTNSMTGYGRDQITIENNTINVEIKSINHRFLDVVLKLPRSLLFLEEKIKRIIAKTFHRGRIEVFISIEGTGFVSRTLTTDWALLDEYMNELKQAKERYQLSGDIPIAMLTALPEIITIHEKEQQPHELIGHVLKSTERAVLKVFEMRKEEGAFLAKDLTDRIKTVQNMVLLIEERRAQVISEYRARILERLHEHLENYQEKIEDHRIYQEISLLAEKGDITEEITRLRSHTELFKETMHQAEAIGRKLDFIVQEMHREINTIGSKSSDSQIGEWTVNLKTILEKIKEQVQNIE